MTIAGILNHKGFNVTTVTPGMTIAEVAQVLASKRIGAVLVLDSAGQLLGILSERDIVACLAENGPRTLEMTAAQLMTAEVQTAKPRMTVEEASGLMSDGRLRPFSVGDEGRLVGL